MVIFNKYKYKNAYKLLFIACYLFHFSTVAIRLSYSTLLVEIVGDFSQSKANVGLGLTFYYFIYALAQIVLSIFITKINVKKFITATTVLSAVTFSLTLISSELWQMFLILGLNGIFQCASWGGLMFIISKYFPEETISYCNAHLISCFAIANAVAYGVSAFFVEFLSWRYVFLFWSILLVLSITIFAIMHNRLENLLKNGDEIPSTAQSLKDDKSIIVPSDLKFDKVKLIVVLSLGALLFHLVNYGFTNWIPNLLTEIHSLKSSHAIFATLGLTLLTVPVTIITYKYLDKTNNVFILGAILSAISVAIFVALTFTYKENISVAIIFSALIKLLITAITTVFSSYIAIKLKNHINGGTTALIFNSISSVGAGIAPFITGAIMDASSFKEYYLFLAITLFIVATTLVILKLSIKKSKDLNEYF